MTITRKGYGKRSEIEAYRLTGRAGKGVINMKVTEKTGRTRFKGSHQEPGGKDYTELVFTVNQPDRRGMPAIYKKSRLDKTTGEPVYSEFKDQFAYFSPQLHFGTKN